MKDKVAPLEAEDKENAPNSPKAPEYDPQELLAIFDEILFSGVYEEPITIKGKLKVIFRSRTAADTTEITKEMDSTPFNLISSYQEKRAFLNVVYSLVSFNGKSLGEVPIPERKTFLGVLPAVVIASLSDALVKFDKKVDAACREGDENF